ncbi:MAG: NfeD family protein [Terracidiphilus sp.]
MNWESFYLICFLVGLALSAVSLLGGMGHFGGHVHLPHVGHVHLPHAGAVGGSHPAGASTRGGANVPWWNAFSLMIFLCWFGAAGYLLTRYGSFVALVVLVLAAICGFAGGAIIFLFLTRVLLPHERELTADETQVVGAVGHVSSAIRSGGIGEVVYEQLGARCCVPARSEDGEPIQKQEEVYVVRYEKGIAFVKRWEEELNGSDRLSVVSDQFSATESETAKTPGDLKSQH